jgi:hypothetical protein
VTDDESRRAVRHRAGNRCEYCRLRQELDELSLQIEHIIPRKHHGSDATDNLALACFACNNHKGPNLTGLDPKTGELTRLLNPRTDRWEDHLAWEGALLVGRTPIGRATVDVLAVNLPYRVELRLALIEEGVFP